MIQCICSYFNFHDNETRKQNYIQFRKKLNCDIITVEVATHKSKFFIDDAIQIVAKERNYLWQKERCFNIALENISDKVDKIIWLDTDIIFQDDSWLKKMSNLLDYYAFAQPFSEVYERHESCFNKPLNCKSYAKSLKDFMNTGEKMEWVAQGIGWGINRSLIPQGFFDRHILGSNDQIQLSCWLGDVFNKDILSRPKWLIQEILQYYEKQPLYDGRNFGYCDVKIEHLYHGKTEERGYGEREEYMTHFKQGHLKIDNNKLYKLNNEYAAESIKKYLNMINTKTKL